MARFSCRPSGDIHAYTSPISACGLATVAGESKWSEARAVAARAAKRTNATRILILNTSVNLRLKSRDARYRIVLDTGFRPCLEDGEIRLTQSAALDRDLNILSPSDSRLADSKASARFAAVAAHALVNFADMFIPSFECPLDHPAP